MVVIDPVNPGSTAYTRNITSLEEKHHEEYYAEITDKPERQQKYNSHRDLISNLPTYDGHELTDS